MSITFCIEAHSDTEDDALDSENAPTLNVHNNGGWLVLLSLGIEPNHYGEIDAADLLARIDAIPDGFINDRLARLREVAVAAHRLHRLVVWG